MRASPKRWSSDFPALIESQPEIVAHHFTEAGLASEAIGYWVKAGRNAYAHWANQEAARFFERALRVLETLPETRATLEQAIDLRFDLKTSLIPLGQFERIIGYLREAGGLAKRLDDQWRLCQFSVHMCQTLGLSGNPKDAVAFGQDAQVLAESLEDVPLQVAAAVFLGTACFSTLDYRLAEHHFLKVLQLLDGELSLEQFSLAGFPAVTAHGFLARIYADQGKFDAGSFMVRKAFVSRRRSTIPTAYRSPTGVSPISSPPGESWAAPSACWSAG